MAVAFPDRSVEQVLKNHVCKDCFKSEFLSDMLVVERGREFQDLCSNRIQNLTGKRNPIRLGRGKYDETDDFDTKSKEYVVPAEDITSRLGADILNILMPDRAALGASSSTATNDVGTTTEIDVSPTFLVKDLIPGQLPPSLHFVAIPAFRLPADMPYCVYPTDTHFVDRNDAVGDIVFEADIFQASGLYAYSPWSANGAKRWKVASIQARSVCSDPSGSLLYVTTSKTICTFKVQPSGDSVQLVKIKEVNVRGAQSLYGISLSNDNRLAVIDMKYPRITLHEPKGKFKNVGTIPQTACGRAPVFSAWSIDSKFLYLTECKDNTITCVELSRPRLKIWWRVCMTQSPRNISLIGDRVFVTYFEGHSVSEMESSTGTLTRQIDCVGLPRGTFKTATKGTVVIHYILIKK